jgi:hypothetical protein
VVLKGMHSTIHGIHARGHNSDGLIIKADSYAPCCDSSVSDVHVESLAANDTGVSDGAIVVVGGTAALTGLNLSNVTVRNVALAGITVEAQGGNTTADVQMSNLNIDGTNGAPGIWLANTGIYRVHVSNAQLNNVSQGVRLDSGVNETQLSNINVHTASSDCIWNNGASLTQLNGHRRPYLRNKLRCELGFGKWDAERISLIQQQCLPLLASGFWSYS